jgi:hypothetical protein
MASSYTAVVPANYAPRLRDDRLARMPIPAEKRAELQAKADEVNTKKKLHVDAWWADTLARSQRMVEEFDITPRRALDLLQCAGMRMVHAHPNGNTWNAFLALKSLELKGIVLIFLFALYHF